MGEEVIVNKAAEQGLSMIEILAKFMADGGIFMWIILGVFCFGLAIAVERIIKMSVFDVKAKNLIDSVKKFVMLNDVKSAIELCSNTRSLLPKVIRAGLLRVNHEKEEIRDSMEATALEVAPMVETRLGFLNLCANVSTLLGLLGTIYGLIQSFAAVAVADPSQKSELLASGISKAMNTTALGLISAIILMVVHSWLTQRADKIYADIEHHSAKMVDFLGTTKKKQDRLEKKVA